MNFEKIINNEILNEDELDNLLFKIINETNQDELIKIYNLLQNYELFIFNQINKIPDNYLYNLNKIMKCCSFKLKSTN